MEEIFAVHLDRGWLNFDRGGDEAMRFRLPKLSLSKFKIRAANARKKFSIKRRKPATPLIRPRRVPEAVARKISPTVKPTTKTTIKTSLSPFELLRKIMPSRLMTRVEQTMQRAQAKYTAKQKAPGFAIREAGPTGDTSKWKKYLPFILAGACALFLILWLRKR